MKLNKNQKKVFPVDLGVFENVEKEIEQFTFDSIEEMLEKYPTAQIAIDNLIKKNIRSGRYLDWQLKYYKNWEECLLCTDVVFEGGIKIKPLAFFGIKKSRENEFKEKYNINEDLVFKSSVAYYFKEIGEW